MSEDRGGSSSVGIVAIVAVLVLALVGAWFMWGRPGSQKVSPPPATSTAPPDDADLDIKVDLPDSITIKK